MFDPTKRIVCINLGTRYVGLAAFQGSDLRDWRVRSFNGKWSRGKERKIVIFLKDYLDRWQPQLVLTKEIDSSRSSSALNLLAAWLTAFLKARGIRSKRYPIGSIVSWVTGREKESRRAIGEELGRRFPALGHELRKEKAGRNPYYQRMFEAVALGSIRFGKLKKL
jgi:hypothetical protein